jgi:Cytidylate kinase-like family
MTAQGGTPGARLRATPPLVTLSASYGAGGSAVGPALAERLGVEFLDRAIPARVAERLAVSLDSALAHDESLGDAIGRLVSSFAMLPELAAAMAQAGVPDGDDYRVHTEAIIREHAAQGAVVLGRAGALVLRDHPDALHVRLDGPAERRVERMMREQGLQRAEAERLRKDADRAREAYVRHFYGADARDPAHYHMVIDSTRLPVACVVGAIAAALRR